MPELLSNFLEREIIGERRGRNMDRGLLLQESKFITRCTRDACDISFSSITERERKRERERDIETYATAIEEGLNGPL